MILSVLLVIPQMLFLMIKIHPNFSFIVNDCIYRMWVRVNSAALYASVVVINPFVVGYRQYW